MMMILTLLSWNILLVFGERTVKLQKSLKSCEMVRGAVKRTSFHFRAMCKCEDREAVLNENCKSQAGDRKFDLTVLHRDLGGLWYLDEASCFCQVHAKTPQEAPDREVEVTEHTQGGTEGNAVEVPKKKQQQSRCADIQNARYGKLYHVSRICECMPDHYLSLECGRLAGESKFHPKASDLRLSTNCSCQSEEQQLGNINFFGGPAVLKDSRIVCKHAFPPGFHFGNLVAISKAESKWQGYIAQVVCSAGTRGVQGRVCLRYANDRVESLGCWHPKNLDVLQ
mmetsp:Transcript_46775/g.84463  ORF Transcript_46775/g.84463 Transcript_46775/m.84463 type:complete len:282 (+) Transcript_46775:60-905(+)